MKTNFQVKKPVFTHEGAPSTNVSPIVALRRSVMACMLWEDNFYEDGQSIVDRIEKLCEKVDAQHIAELALNAHKRGFLRHVPLKLIVEGLKKKNHITPLAHCIVEICNRPDQMTELLSLYWKNGKKPLAAQLKKGLARAFTQFDEYQLAKWNKDAPIKLRDVLFLSHAKPENDEQAELWKRLIAGTMKTPETWEVKLSAGEKKDEAFAELLEKGKMGKLAIIRNLRNMRDSGVSADLVRRELMKNSRPLLPFQFIQAAKIVPEWEEMIDASMIQALQDKEKMPGTTVLFVDVSGSMTGATVSAKSQVTHQDAASGLAILLRESCETLDVFSFSDALAFVPARHGMALRDAIVKSQPNQGTHLGAALRKYLEIRKKDVKIDRIIVVTDEQLHDVPPKMGIDKCYILNVSNCQHGIKNNGEWTVIHGFSEASIDYIREIESFSNQ
jgi:hypothetical protein